MAVDKTTAGGKLLRRAKQAFGALHRALYRVSDGRIGGTMRGVPVLLLTTRGRKTGKLRTVPVVYDLRDGAYLVAPSNAGHWEPAWLLNLQADSRATVDVGRRRLEVTAEIIDGAEGQALWSEYEELHPTYPKYRESRGEDFPMVKLHPG